MRSLTMCRSASRTSPALQPQHPAREQSIKLLKYFLTRRTKMFSRIKLTPSLRAFLSWFPTNAAYAPAQLAAGGQGGAMAWERGSGDPHWGKGTVPWGARAPAALARPLGLWGRGASLQLCGRCRSLGNGAGMRNKERQCMWHTALCLPSGFGVATSCAIFACVCA